MSAQQQVQKTTPLAAGAMHGTMYNLIQTPSRRQVPDTDQLHTFNKDLQSNAVLYMHAKRCRPEWHQTRFSASATATLCVSSAVLNSSSFPGSFTLHHAHSTKCYAKAFVQTKLLVDRAQRHGGQLSAAECLKHCHSTCFSRDIAYAKYILSKCSMDESKVRT